MGILKGLIVCAIILIMSMGVSAETFYCDTCADCNAKIQNASIGDTVLLTTDIVDFSGHCINFNGKDGIVFDGGGHMIDGIDTYGTNGIYFTSYSDNNVIKNCTITDFGKGIYLYTSNYNTIENTTSSSNRDTGITILYGRENVIRDCVMEENRGDDFYFRPYVLADCDTVLENVTGSGGRNIGFYDSSVNISDQEFSSICLCNADNSVFDNITVSGSNTIRNNGIFMFFTDGTIMSNVTANTNYRGISLDDCYSCMIRDSVFNDHPHYNIFIGDGSNNVIDNVTANSSGQAGLYLSHADNNVVSNSVFYNDPFGIMIDSSNMITINGTHIIGNNICGISAGGTYGHTFYNNYFDNDENVNMLYDHIQLWNVSKRDGPNIIGGPFIGGNYWNDYDYNDMDGDGFGCVPYAVSLGTDNIDYLPLVNVSGGEEMYIRNWNVTLYRGDVWEYLVTCRNESGFDVECGDLTWNSSNTTVGTMDGANITCLAPGYTNVTVVGFNNTDTITAEVQFLECGDVDCDSRVTINDVVEAYFRVINPSYEIGSEWAADVDNDDRITINDVVEIYFRVINPSYALHCAY